MWGDNEPYYADANAVGEALLGVTMHGITIATLSSNPSLTPLVYGSANNLVAAFYDQGGKRLIFDGGFTRLYNKWDTAGTGRYVKNAATWLANVERFPTHALAVKNEGSGPHRSSAN